MPTDDNESTSDFVSYETMTYAKYREKWMVPMPRTHYILSFTRRDADGRQMSACGEFIDKARHSTEPTCPHCQNFLVGDTAVNANAIGARR